MKKEFILSSNAAISAEKITLAFDGDNDVTIPMVVLEELYHYNGIPEKVIIANRFVEYLENLDMNKLISKNGVVQENGSVLRVVDNNKIDSKLQHINNLTASEKRLIQVCLDRKINKDVQVVLITQNPALRMKVAKLGIDSQPLKDEIFPAPEDQYTGRKVVSVSQTTLDEFFKNGSISIKDIYESKKVDWKENMFVVLKSEKGTSAIGRYTQKEVVKLKYYTENKNDKNSSCKANNVEQKMLMECLLAPPEIAPLVVVKGAAGTGKTFCTLSAALEQLSQYATKGIYSQILVGTPIVTIEENIGFLPGSIDEKVGPYLGGIMDNLKMIFKYKNSTADNACLEDMAEELFDRKFIKIQSIGHLRGRSIPYTMFIVDETQNIQPSILLDIVTRAATGTKIVLLGDPTQVNKPGLNTRRNGLVYISEKMKGHSLCWQVTLDSGKSIRSDLAQEALKIL